MQKRKNILFIASRLPINLNSGDRLRVYHFIKGLKQRGYQIDLTGFAPDEDYAMQTDIKSLCRNYISVKKKWLGINKASRVTQLKTFFLSLIYGYPYRVWQWQDKKLLKTVSSLTAQNYYDVIHFSGLGAGISFVQVLKKRERIKALLVYDMIDSFSLGLKNSLMKNAFLLPFRFLDFFRLKKFERQIVHQSNQPIIVSKHDKSYIGYDEITVVPNGITKTENSAVQRDIDLLFVGKMSYDANIDAIGWFIKKVIPKLPNLKLYIAGAKPSERVKKMAADNIIVTGFVEDINEFYQRAKLFICPMRIGAGQKNKILEAMINRTPVISTTEGNNGIEAPETAIAIANSADEFAAKIEFLLKNERKREHIADNGYDYANNNFSWKKSVDLLEQCYQAS